MEVVLAEHFGMCFGVKDAIAMAQSLARREALTVLGDLVHNEDVVASLEAAGVKRTKSEEDIQTNSVLLTAHGTSNRVKLKLAQEGYQLHDAVCPLVKRAHLALMRLVSQGRYPVIIGQENHVEVRGMVGDLDAYSVVLHESDLHKLRGIHRMGIVSQTTQPIEEVRKLVSTIRLQYPTADIAFVDTVCQPTKDRQDSLRRLVDQTEVVIVVGGPESNNSRKLKDLATSLGKPSYQVARAQELNREWFHGVRRVGLTAGTSTPDQIIQEVRETLLKI